MIKEWLKKNQPTRLSNNFKSLEIGQTSCAMHMKG